MTDALVLYTNPMSRGRFARWCLEEIGAPYHSESIAWGPAMKSPDYLAINPMGKVPALKHGDTVITECVAICAYLADAFPEAGLAPAVTDRLRGPYYRWLFFAAGPLETTLTNTRMGFSLEGMPLEKRGVAGSGSLAEVVTLLDAALDGREYLLGERFTTADLVVSSYLMFGMHLEVLPKRANFERYVGQMLGRPAAQRANEIDDALQAELPPEAAPAG